MSVRTGISVTFFAVSLVLYVGSNAGQVSTSVAQTERGSISGVVVRAGSGEPVRKAMVSLRVLPEPRKSDFGANNVCKCAALSTTFCPDVWLDRPQLVN